MVAYARKQNPPRRTYNPSARKSIAKKTYLSGNTAVKRVYKKASVAPKSRVAVNKSAIATLAKQVKSLQLRNIGQFQKGYTHVKLGYDHALSTLQPFIFAINDMTNNAPMYMGKTDTTSFPATAHSPAFEIPGFIPTAHFAKYTPPFTLGEFSYWKGALDDECSRDSFLPISTEIMFNFEAPSLAVNQVHWARIDIIRMKRVLLHSNSNNLSLPQNVQQLGNLATEDMVDRNRFNRQYFDVLYTKWVKFENKNDQAKTINKYVKYTHKFKGTKPIKLGAHDTVSTPTGDVNPSFFTNVPQNEIIWCLISSSNGNKADTNVVKAEVTRTCCWRDSEGVAT